MAESAPWAVGELVVEALSPVDPVAYSRIALVYGNFPDVKVFWRVSWADRGG
jgi:transcriptional regulator NrdR family protein